MSHKITTIANPYEEGHARKKTTITVEPGVTVLVGCNGAGKTTMLDGIEQHLRNLKIPVMSYNHRRHGENHAIDMSRTTEDLTFALASLYCSEGENINMNLAKKIPAIKSFITKLESDSNERWLLFDAVDSGFDISNIRTLKGMFDAIIRTKPKNIEVYIVVSANTYEMVKGMSCINVTTGKSVSFETYDEFANFIIKNAKQKAKHDKTNEE